MLVRFPGNRSTHTIFPRLNRNAQSELAINHEDPGPSQVLASLYTSIPQISQNLHSIRYAHSYTKAARIKDGLARAPARAVMAEPQIPEPQAMPITKWALIRYTLNGTAGGLLPVGF